jgi:hypothetical protein
MAIELAPFNIQVNAIAPLFIETDMTEPVKTMPQLYQEVIARTPAARWGNPDELAGTAVFFGIPSFRFRHRCDHRRRWLFRDPVSSKLGCAPSNQRKSDFLFSQFKGVRRDYPVR